MTENGRHAAGPRREPAILLAALAALLVVSGIGPVDRLTWWLEVAPILLTVPLLVATSGRFPLTPLVYRLIFIHALILMLGAHYTYERVPLGEWAQAAFGLGRNHYDRLGHFAQGFIPAIVTREVLLRTSPLRQGKWLFTLTCAVCLAGSACFEFCEWTAATMLGQSADAYLATQGDPWDTQWDMLLALVGSIVAQVALGRIHDRELAAGPLPAGRR